MGATSREEDRGEDEFRLPLERAGATWRFGLAAAFSALLLLQVLSLHAPKKHETEGEWAPLLAALLLPQILGLIVSGIGIRRGWSPNLLFRLLPLLVLIGLFLIGFALG